MFVTYIWIVPIWLRSVIFTLLLPGLIAGYAPYWLVTGSTPMPLDLGVFRWLGLLPLGLGLVMYLNTTWHFGAEGRGTPAPWDPPRQLVTSALHAWVRNPMYLGVLSCILGEAFLWQAGVLFVYCPLIWLLFHVRVLVYEEPVLKREFGAAFDAYVARVPRWVPRRPAT